MPKSLNKIKCPACFKEISASAYMNHVKGNRADHEWLILEFEKIKFKLENERLKNCKNCNKEMKLKEITLNFAMIKFFNLNARTTGSLKEFCSKNCSSNPWNKNLTKNSDERLKRISESRKGINNPIHQICDDPIKKNQWIDSIKKSLGDYHNSNKSIKGKSLQEFYGEDKAEQIKSNLSDGAKKRKKHGHTGLKHSEETKKLIAEKITKLHSETKNKVSNVQMQLFNFLVDYFKDQEIILEFNLKYYSVDIAFPNSKLAIEVDGDFYHVNEELGYEAKSKIQKRNLKNDIKKNNFYLENGWTCLRFWESDINNNMLIIAQKIEKTLCKN
jgi:very-short-patch-repair endonuclease